MNETETLVERHFQAKPAAAPRITPADLDAEIIDAKYHRFPSTTVTVCCLKTKCGYCVIGESAAVNAENFDEDLGKSVAYSKARDKLWPLLGFRLASRSAPPQ